MSQPATLSGFTIPLPGGVADPWPDTDAVPVIDVARKAHVPRYDVRTVELEGLVSHLPKRGPKGSLMVSKDDALFLLGCAALAVAAGIALVTVVRVLRETGAQPGGLPLPGAA